MFKFEGIQNQFVVLVLFGIAMFLLQDCGASFASREMKATTDLWSSEAWNDAVVVDAFEKAKSKSGVAADLEMNPTGFHPERHDHLSVYGKTKDEALEARHALIVGMREILQPQGYGAINSDHEAPYADPVPNDTTAKIKRAFQVLSFIFFAWAVIGLLVQSFRAKLPLIGIVGIVLTTLTILTSSGSNNRRAFQSHTPTVFDLLWIYGLALAVPLGFIGLVAYLTYRVRKAAGWVQGRARILKSDILESSVQGSGRTPVITRQSAVEYEFIVGSNTYRSGRISLGLKPADGPDQTARRYVVGSTVPVFYDVENPADCVLEREPPIKLRWLWTITILAVIIYCSIVVRLAS